jgi:hypothetical protein
MKIGNVSGVEYRHLLFDQVQNAAHIRMFSMQLKGNFRHAAVRRLDISQTGLC